MVGSGFKLIKIFGISIYIDWSWFLIFLLVTWTLSTALFGPLHPDWSPLVTWGAAILASLLFFFSVLLHELAHSLVAIARGLPVKRITLFIFGGVSNIEREPPSPATEFLVTIVGPLTSLILGVLFLFLGGSQLNLGGITFGGTTQALSQLDLLTTLLLWLGPINIILGFFNLIPAFPLDGGRILRSIFWAATDNLRRATRWAAAISQVIAWGLIILGITMAFGVQIPILGTGLISGLWLAFIGWFLKNAAAQSYRQVVVADMLEGIPVSRLMYANAPTVSPNQTVSQLVYDNIMGTNEHAFPVTENNKLVGLVSLEDVRKIPRDDWDVTRVQSVMTPVNDLTIVSPREDATDAFQKLTQKDVNQMPVVQNGELVGILRRRDIMRWLQMQSDYS
ncbi:MAG: CBS domain-containing protein [Chloroflexi bacterium]|nr:MAG: CBS domain-containing protein [Chloroflexota bacterium]